VNRRHADRDRLAARVGLRLSAPANFIGDFGLGLDQLQHRPMALILGSQILGRTADGGKGHRPG